MEITLLQLIQKLYAIQLIDKGISKKKSPQLLLFILKFCYLECLKSLEIQSYESEISAYAYKLNEQLKYKLNR